MLKQALLAVQWQAVLVFAGDDLAEEAGRGDTLGYSSKAPPLIISDALASNRPSRVDSLGSLCNNHGRRQFYDIYEQFPVEVEYVLMRYRQIWEFDDDTEKLSEAERLAYHQQHSLGIMEEIKGWCSEHLANETVEENSSLGKAMKYFPNHYQGLTSFCRLKGAKLDNNRMETKLKLVVRNRKNAMFHKIQAGADIGDVITSLIATAEEAGIYVFDYFNLIQ
ncbi:transposase [Thalassomonas viridans]|uniref:Transposase n=1 Tax=Thalassomonas viridans TaxID=137584 RepID=A0AAF0CAN4_9GAMM|nr:transposase [Thalassomonas viridans]WDE08742.1 transposase [Thalassomonas viridans]